MKNIKLLLGLLATTAFFFCACNNPSTTKKEGMSEFSDDKEFKEKHESPVNLDDYKPQGSTLKIKTEDGGETTIYGLRPKRKTPKYLLVFHEWWGLNKHIKKEADRLYNQLDEKLTVIAVDLYDGEFAEDRDRAAELMKSVKEERANAIIKAIIERMQLDANYLGGEPQFATVGWCFGGGWSLKASVLAGEEGVGCVMYYGMPVKSAAELAPLQADILNIHPKEDKWINQEVIDEFETLTKATGKNLTVHQFDADHAFANPSSPRYNEAAAQEANAKVLAFLKEKLNI